MVSNTKRILSNSLSLLFIQIANYIAPFLVLPYLSRTLGVEGFGTVALLMSIATIASIVTDYGFNLSAAHDIAKSSDNKEYINRYIGTVFTIKIILVLAILFFLFLYSTFGTDLLASNYLLPVVFFTILSRTFQPTWFFQGIEKMRSVTVYMVIAKLMYLILVFIFVHNKGDEWIVMLCFGVSNLVASIISIFCIYKEGYKVKVSSWPMMKSVFKNSSGFFLSRVSVSIYTALSTFIVGSVAGLHQAALYSSCEKLYQGGQSLTSPISQALFPYMARTGDKKLFYKFVLFSIIPMIVGCAICIHFSSDILSFIFGPEFAKADRILDLFLACTVIVFIAVNFGYPAFASINKVRVANITVMFGAIVQCLSLLFLYFTDSISALSVTVAVLITESVVMSLRLILFFKLK
ncbi:oligosaccharide flippase family protein [Vibrio profundum]|uniref:oligosaccharide flippase family protein n=1 Tax=Vibrio profundum TaxID=2910247 RepID=UPI003D151DB1